MNYQNLRNRSKSIVSTLVLFTVLSGFAAANSLTDKRWRVTFQTGKFGPVETILEFKKDGEGFHAYNLSGSREVIETLPQVKSQKAEISKYLMAFTLRKDGDAFRGEMYAPWKRGKISMAFTGKEINGKISGGLFAGSFSGVPFDSKQKALRDYSAVIDYFVKTVSAKVFNPRALETREWKEFTKTLKKIGSTARDDLDVLLGFYFAYEGKPFSHLTFAKGRGPANELMAQFDKYRVGGKPAEVTFEGNIAILKVKTMMGVDTIELIEAAYNEIAASSAKALIIDLRGNGGGAFAIKPLIEHVIDKPLDAGYFVTHKWNLKYTRLPSKRELMAVKPWQGFSLKAWWANIQTESIIRLRFNPQQPNFNGPVFVLIDSRSASATEMAADALSVLENVTVVGEKTAGEVLSQSPFDTSDGFQAFVPVADYYSVANGRLEGVGVKPNIEAKSADAMGLAKKLARKAIAKEVNNGLRTN